MGHLIRLHTRQARKRLGLTQEAWADATYQSVYNVRRLEYRHGLPSWPTALRMARVAGQLRIKGTDGDYLLIPVDPKRTPPGAPGQRIPGGRDDEQAA